MKEDMDMANVTLTQLTDDDREQFILDNQRAFKFGAMEEFGNRDDHMEEDGEIISRKTIEDSIDGGAAYRIREDGRIVGGLVLTIDEETQHNRLDLLFVTPDAHSKGIGYAAWKEAERLYPETLVWETCTPYFETRNIHFYVNKCGFHIVEFFNSHHPDPHDPETGEENNYEGEDFDGMFRFEKRMK
jgi:GNAT superfamily N-acetyltransferase